MMPGPPGAFGLPGARACRVCGRPGAGGALICPGCGGVGPIEEGLARTRRRAARIGRPLRAWLGRNGAWLLAATPLLIGPPLLVLVVAAWRRGSPRRGAVPRPWLLALAGVNIALSLVMWWMLHEQAAAALGWGLDWVVDPMRRRGPPAAISI